MREDPFSGEWTTFARPPSAGPGSGKAAWVEFANRTVDANANLAELVDSQSQTIRELRAEVELLRGQIQRIKPKGGRPRTSDKTTACIEAEVAAGYSIRQAAVRNGVSPMTVSRIVKRAAERMAIAERDA